MSNVFFEKPLFGANIEITLYDVAETLALPVLEEAYIEALRLQKIFNFFDPYSELSKLNKERALKVSEEFIEVLKKALFYCEKTKGEYDISLGKQIIQRKKGEEITPIGCSFKDIKIKDNLVKLEHPDVIIDFGSIAKGYIVDKIAEFLIKKGIENGCIDARGDIRVFGEGAEKIEIQHPRDKSKTIFPIKIKDSAVATSGDYNQFYGSYDQLHILNKKDLISVTVIAKTLVEADVLASVVFLLDKNKRESFLKDNSQIKTLTIDKNLKSREYNGFSKIKLNKNKK